MSEGHLLISFVFRSFELLSSWFNSFLSLIPTLGVWVLSRNYSWIYSLNRIQTFLLLSWNTLHTSLSVPFNLPNEFLVLFVLYKFLHLNWLPINWNLWMTIFWRGWWISNNLIYELSLHICRWVLWKSDIFRAWNLTDSDLMRFFPISWIGH